MSFHAFDLETHLFGPGNMAPKPVCVSCCDSLAPSLYEMWGPAARIRVESMLHSKKTINVGHHVCYDFACIMGHWPDLTELIFEAYATDRVTDTELRMMLLDLSTGDLRGYYSRDGKRAKINYTLETTAWRMAGIVLEKGAVRTSYGELDGVPLSRWPREAVDYSMNDAIATYATAMAQEKLAQQTPGVLEDQFRQARKHLALHLASVWGIRTNGETLEDLAKKTKARIEEHREELLEAGFLRVNGSRDMKAIYAAVLAEDPDCEKTPTGLPKVGAEELARCKSPTLVAMSGYGKAVSLLTGSIKDLRAGVDQPIHTWFNPILESGRIATSSPNILNLRREPGIRECIEPRPGYLLAACDYDKAELHAFAEVCFQVLGFSTMGEALNDGIDIHLDVGAQLIGLTYEEALEYKNEPEVKEARQRAKPGVFGFLGGMGVDGFLGYAQGQYGLEFTEDQASLLKETYFSKYPEIGAYFDWIRGLLGQTDVYTARQLGSNRLRAHCRYTVLANTFFQGLATDAFGAALFALARKMYSTPDSFLYGCRTIIPPHDEVIAEVHDDPELADAAARELQSTMIEAFNEWTPHYPVRAEVALMYRWQKGARQVEMPMYTHEGLPAAPLLVPDPATKLPLED